MEVSIRKTSRLVVVFLLSFLLATSWFATAFAQEPASDRAGLSITPAMEEDLVEPGQTHTYTLRITNREDRDRILFLTPRHIVGAGDGGTPIFADRNEPLTGFELASWFTFDQTEIAIGPNETESVLVSIAIPEDAPPGSHFAGVNIASEAPQLRESGAGIAYGVTNIVTLLVAGDADSRAMIRSLSTDRYIYGSTNVEFTARVDNPGNVLQRPTGPLEIYNMFGQEVGRLVMNESRAGVFPGNDRVFQVTWSQENPGFGKYEAILSMAYGSAGASQTMSTTVSFWILPMAIIGPAAGVLAVLLVIVYFGVRLYVRSAIAQHSGSVRRIQSTRRRTGTPLGLTMLIAMLVTTAIFLIILLALFA